MKRIVLFFLKKYKMYFSKYGFCRFYPTCSEYTYDAVTTYGVFKGLFLGLKRIFKCNRFLTRVPGEYDPVV